MRNFRHRDKMKIQIIFFAVHNEWVFCDEWMLQASSSQVLL